MGWGYRLINETKQKANRTQRSSLSASWLWVWATSSACTALLAPWWILLSELRQGKASSSKLLLVSCFVTVTCKVTNTQGHPGVAMQFVYVSLRMVLSGAREARRRTKAQIWGVVGRSWHVQKCFHNTETTSQGLRSTCEDIGWTPDKGLATRAEPSSIYFLSGKCLGREWGLSSVSLCVCFHSKVNWVSTVLPKLALLPKFNESLRSSWLGMLAPSRNFQRTAHIFRLRTDFLVQEDESQCCQHWEIHSGGKTWRSTWKSLLGSPKSEDSVRKLLGWVNWGGKTYTQHEWHNLVVA